MSTMSRRELVLDELRMVRGYTLDLIQNTDPAGSRRLRHSHVSSRASPRSAAIW